MRRPQKIIAERALPPFRVGGRPAARPKLIAARPIDPPMQSPRPAARPVVHRLSPAAGDGSTGDGSERDEAPEYLVGVDGIPQPLADLLESGVELLPAEQSIVGKAITAAATRVRSARLKHERGTRLRGRQQLKHQKWQNE